MIEDADALAACLAGTLLAGRKVAVHQMPGSGDRLFAVRIDETELLPAWTAARALVDRTGRWPAASNVGIFPAPSIDVSALDICAEEVDKTVAEDWALVGQEVFAELREAQGRAWPPPPLEVRLRYQLSRTMTRCGSAPRPAEVLERFPTGVSDFELERWLLEWEEARRPTAATTQAGHLQWFFDPGAPLMFFPTQSGPYSIAYAPFYGEEDMPGLTTHRLITVLEFWRRTYGAELVAHWGTMLQLLVARPPTTLDDAWNLATQQALVARDTVTAPAIALRDHARALLHRPTWFLHCRP